MSGFGIMQGKGFHITFENGYTLSVQFGTGNYCSVRYSAKWGDEKKVDMWESPNAEIAVIKPGGGFMGLEEFGLDYTDADVVAGWQTPEEVLELMNKVKDLVPVEA